MRYPSAIGTRPAAVAATPDVTRDDERRGDHDRPRNAAHDQVWIGQAGHAERREQDLRLREAVEQDRADAERDHDDVGERQPGSSRPLKNGRRRTRPSSSTSAYGAIRPSSRNQTVNTSAFERQVSRPYWAIIASVSAV